jgi:hypothetical protein
MVDGVRPLHPCVILFALRFWSGIRRNAMTLSGFMPTREEYERLVKENEQWKIQTKNLIDMIGLFIWKAGGTVLITSDDKAVMPEGVYVEVFEDKVKNETTFRLIDNLKAE